MEVKKSNRASNRFDARFDVSIVDALYVNCMERCAQNRIVSKLLTCGGRCVVDGATIVVFAQTVLFMAGKKAIRSRCMHSTELDVLQSGIFGPLVD